MQDPIMPLRAEIVYLPLFCSFGCDLRMRIEQLGTSIGYLYELSHSLTLSPFDMRMHQLGVCSIKTDQCSYTVYSLL
jgi:hypothetical protein